MEIADGGAASLEFLGAMITSVSPSARKQVRDPLERCCGRDTGGITEILEELNSLYR